VQGQAGRPGTTALTYESYPHNSTDFAPRTRGVKDLFRNPIWKLFRLSRISRSGSVRGAASDSCPYRDRNNPHLRRCLG
jgi:hypothetical protein